MSIKAIVMDVDGTLLNSKKIISPKTKAVLLKAQAQGIKLILASGRPTPAMFRLGEELEMNKNRGLFISFNGSKVIDVQTMAELFNEPMSIEEGKAVLEHLKQFAVVPIIDKADYMYVNDVFAGMINRYGVQHNAIQFEARSGNYKLCEKTDLAAFVDYPLNKILTAADPEYLQANYQAMMAPFTSKLSCMFTAPFYFEFTAKGIDKAKALDTVLAPLEIVPEELISFGDGHNDLSIIKYAGIGVAMANAVADLKAVADEITLSNDEDGIAEALLQHLPELF